MGSPAIRHRVQRYVSEHEGQTIYADGMATDLGLSLEQVQGQMRNLIYSGMSIKVLHRGQSWVHPNPDDLGDKSEGTPDTRGTVYEEIGRSRTGKPIIQDTAGVVYVATEVDI